MRDDDNYKKFTTNDIFLYPELTDCFDQIVNAEIPEVFDVEGFKFDKDEVKGYYLKAREIHRKINLEWLA